MKIKKIFVNIQIEEVVFGGMFLEKEGLMVIIDKLKIEDFYDIRYQLIFNVVKDVYLSGIFVDLMIVVRYL